MFFHQTKDFPRCGAFLKVRFPDLELFSPKIFAAFAETCGDEALARKALQLETHPTVRISKLMRNGHHARNVGGAFMGECDPAVKNTVFINTTIAQGYEDHRENGVIFERTVLHEMVHWARFTLKLPARIDDKEAGSWFEWLAYDIPYIGHSGMSCPNS